jgi:hypothetical protein
MSAVSVSLHSRIQPDTLHHEGAPCSTMISVSTTLILVDLEHFLLDHHGATVKAAG